MCRSQDNGVMTQLDAEALKGLVRAGAEKMQDYWNRDTPASLQTDVIEDLLQLVCTKPTLSTSNHNTLRGVFQELEHIANHVER